MIEHSSATLEKASAVLGATSLLVFVASMLVIDRPAPGWLAMTSPGSPEAADAETRRARGAEAGGHDDVFAFFVGNPIYYRSTLALQRPGGTDLELKGIGWDGDALYFPIDGGVRWMRWYGQAGFMLEHLHNKAIARLGRGAHGRRLRYPTVEEVAASGTLKGEPAPARIRLADLFDRLEFTHGHNMLFGAGLLKLASPLAMVRPYLGLGGGVAFPHTEVWFKGEAKGERTYEYQYAGPAAQGVAGLELKVGRASYFLEYKFSYAWISGALTGTRSWADWDVFGDLWRQFRRWQRGEKPKHGAFQTTLGAHQILLGIGYRRQAPARR
jgi:hypothetical protein